MRRWVLGSVLACVVVSAQPVFAQGSVLVMGGGLSDSDALAWFVEQAPTKRILILDYADDPSVSFQSTLRGLGTATVAYQAIETREAALDTSWTSFITAFDGIFLPGGNQWRYVERWRDTPVSEAIQAVYERGGIIAGTSAGAMVLSEVVFDAQLGTVFSVDALQTPFDAPISLTDSFLGLVPDVLVDTHFYERGRVGRLLAMLGRYHMQTGRWVDGWGIDDNTAFGVAPNGIATVFGSGVVSILKPRRDVVLTADTFWDLDTDVVQLTGGMRYDVIQGNVLDAETAFAKEVGVIPYRSTLQHVFLDGSLSALAWDAEGGSIAQVVARAEPNQICLVSNQLAPQRLFLQNAFQRRVPSATVTPFAIDDASPPDWNAQLSSCDAIAVVFESEQHMQAAVGQADLVAALIAKGDAGAVLFLPGVNAKLAGSHAVWGTEARNDGAYRGALTLGDGMGLIDGLMVMPGVWNPATKRNEFQFRENHTAGLWWGVAQAENEWGVWLPEGTVLELDAHQGWVSGETPLVAVQLSEQTGVALPDESVSSAVGPRQNAAVESARLRVVAPGESIVFALPVAREEEPNFHSQERLRISAYPNPFGEELTVVFELEQTTPVSVEVVNAIGQRVYQRSLNYFEPGAHQLVIDGALGWSRGVYWVRLTTATTQAVRKVVRH